MKSTDASEQHAANLARSQAAITKCAESMRAFGRAMRAAAKQVNDALESIAKRFGDDLAAARRRHLSSAQRPLQKDAGGNHRQED